MESCSLSETCEITNVFFTPKACLWDCNNLVWFGLFSSEKNSSCLHLKMSSVRKKIFDIHENMEKK